MYGTPTVSFVVSWLEELCFWLCLRALFANFGGYPFPASVALKVPSSLYMVFSFAHTVHGFPQFQETVSEAVLKKYVTNT
jgi:hypothetical protein